MDLFFENDYLNIFKDVDKVFVEVKSPGFSLMDFNEVMKSYPQIGLNNFMALKSALENPCPDKVEIGYLKPQIDLSISQDKLSASMKLNIPQEEIDSDPNLKSKIISFLNEGGVTYGIKEYILDSTLLSGDEVTIAEGLSPVDGEDATVRYKEKGSKKPTIREDGHADFYEMNLIEHVIAGDWLGEKTFSTEGTPGMTVTGEILPPKPGKDKILTFDRKTVNKVREESKLILKAKIDGALSYANGKIGVLNHLHIAGDVGYETGNINFDGYVTIEGTIVDGFKVHATKDISINGNMGIGAVEEIYSSEGSIFIKGGVSGKAKARIYASREVFAKYANACFIEAGESINLGFYALDSVLTSKRIIVNSPKGKIIGGTINAESQVLVSTIGNQMEKKTIINVKGFNRNEIKAKLDEILIRYKYCLNEIEKNSREMKIFEEQMSQNQNLKDHQKYEHILTISDKFLEELSKLEAERKSLMECLESKGEGEISIMQRAYPQTFIEIKNIQKRIESMTIGTFYTKDNKLHFE